MGGRGASLNGKAKNTATNKAIEITDAQAKILSKYGASPLGRNKFAVEGFRSKQSFNNHWKDHKNQYPNFTQEQYKARALNLIESSVGKGILGHVDKDGILTRYDVKENDFAKGKPSKGIYTMFKPDDGIEYYKKMRRIDIERGGYG